MQGVEAQAADFRGADLRQANLGGAYLDGAMMPAKAVELDSHLPPKDVHPSHNGQRVPEKEPELEIE